MRTIELNPAYVWDCDECGRENFQRGCVPEFSNEEMAQMRINMGLQPWEEGSFIQMPDSVVCQHCGATFLTEHYDNA